MLTALVAVFLTELLSAQVAITLASSRQSNFQCRFGLGAVWLTWQAFCTETESGAFVQLHPFFFFDIFLQSLHHPSHCFHYN